MYFLLEDDDLLEKYNTIWGKVSADIKTLTVLCLQQRIFENRIRSHGDEVTNF